MHIRPIIVAVALATTFAALPAAAQDGYYDRNGYNHDGYNRDGYNRSGYNHDGYNRQGYDRNRHYYRDRGQDCRRSNGTTGTIAGAVGGGLIGNAVGGGTLGTLAGAGGGALLGRHIDQRHDAAENRRNGC